ncbi:hypothetical protein POX_e06959 [Penicillium oxalicum]|uniref:Uncharacterized protein n=1 Tax=Penicillium oxalicum (strain 114-2 / CGMCC 5302) TaxID=933388 RepID=S8APX6_PENO1|nr:hypothetical protein POX_e06959 [Penicillium oxalicum]EPS27988.1 hypothetical protein PDE_02933 [Penicillium oxalicum 114-2]KAI2788935.1 hypothetical protein POX_e06959 [Penicillium oxalicum]
MTDSKEEGKLRGTVECLLPGKERRGFEENVRTWERECESEHDGVYREAYLPPHSERGGGPAPRRSIARLLSRFDQAWHHVPRTPTVTLLEQRPCALASLRRVQAPNAEQIRTNRSVVLAAANQETWKGTTRRCTQGMAGRARSSDE